MRSSYAARWSPGIALGRNVSGSMQAVGGLFAMSANAVKFTARRTFQWRECLEQAWFVARVSLAPTLLVAIPFTVLVSFTLNVLLRELGAADLSGAGAAFGAVTQVGPLATVLVAAGAAATATKAVGNAVNETVVYAFTSLFVVNVVVTAIGIQMTVK
jgi:phospholipid/cholesterol/gamma-HCH transport system permease protein